MCVIFYCNTDSLYKIYVVKPCWKTFLEKHVQIGHIMQKNCIGNSNTYCLNLLPLPSHCTVSNPSHTPISNSGLFYLFQQVSSLTAFLCTFIVTILSQHVTFYFNNNTLSDDISHSLLKSVKLLQLQIQCRYFSHTLFGLSFETFNSAYNLREIK